MCQGNGIGPGGPFGGFPMSAGQLMMAQQQAAAAAFFHLQQQQQRVVGGFPNFPPSLFLPGEQQRSCPAGFPFNYSPMGGNGIPSNGHHFPNGSTVGPSGFFASILQQVLGGFI
jgi:hypothetical protein